MKKIVTLFILAFFVPAIPVFSAAAESPTQDKNNKTEQNTTNESHDKADMKIVKKAFYNADSVNKTMKSFTDKLKADNKGGDRLLSPDYMIFAAEMEKFYKYPDIELEALVYRVWFKKLYDAAVGMCNIRRYENLALSMKQQDKVEKYKEEYKKYFNDFRNLIVNKKKYEIPDDKLREMQKKKKEAEEAARKKKTR